MITKTIRNLGILAVAMTALAVTFRAEAQTVLFSDTFDRPDNQDIDASSAGMSGPAAPMTYSEAVDVILGDDQFSQIAGSSLYLAYGPNASVVGLVSYNFTNDVILTDGGFSISMDIADAGTLSDVDRWCGFGVGLSYNAVTNLDRDFNSSAGPRGTWNRSQTGVADFYVDWSPNADSVGSVQIFTSGTAGGEQIALTDLGAANGGTLKANFYPGNFNSGSTVTAEIYFNNTLIATRTFSWSNTGENYISLSCRQNNSGMQVNNFLVQSITVTNAHPQLFWVGDGGANQWNTSSLNWSNLVLGVSTNYSDGNDVTFNDISANTSVSISGTVNPGSVTVDNNVNDYTFSGGVIGGTNGLTKSSSATLTMNLDNTYSGGTVLSAGRLRAGTGNSLGTGLLTLSGGTLSSVGTTPRTVTNSVLITSASGFGDAVDKGVLTFTAPVEFNGAGRNVTVASDVVFSGGASNGRIGTLQGTGTLTLLNGGVEFSGGASDVKEGTLIVDGAAVTNTDRLITDAALGTGIARLVVTNGGSVTTLSTANNLRVGLQSPTPGTNIVDLAGLYSTPNASLANGRILLHNSASLYSELNLFTGGEYSARSVGADGGGFNPTRINFNGGMIRALENSAMFFEGITETYVQSAGANIDDGGFEITINQSLLDGGGGLTKLGSGTLTLAGYNTYTGPTVVNEGTLETSANSFGGGGTLVVADAGNLKVTDAGSPVSASALTLGSSGGSAITFNFPFGNAFSAALSVGSLTANGTTHINISGTSFTVGQFPLMQFTSATGLGNFQLGSVQPGVTAFLVFNANSIDLVITSIVNSLAWSGASDNKWDTTTFNWLDSYYYTGTNYSQTAGAGDAVTFDDYAAGPTDIDVTLAVTPVSVTFNNNSYNYSFAGAGRISGVAKLTQNGYATVTLGTANDYTGGTEINAGYLYVGADQALGDGEVTMNFGTLASDGTTARTLSNSIVLNTDFGVVLGDTINSGTLNLAGTLDLNSSGTRTLQLNSDVAITSSGILNNGGFTAKTGPGRLIVQGEVHQSALVNHQQGDVILNGGWLESGNGWRMQNTFPGTTLQFVVTNGGLFTLDLDSANFRVGLTGGDDTADNILDIAGTVSLFSTTGNGRVDMGQSGANDILNLRSGGLLICRRITSTTPGNTVVNLDGGTLKPIASDGAFMQGLNNAYVLNGGVTVDTTNYDITIAQALQASGTGGLTKMGSGTLTLSGANTYTGPTAVNAGKLILTTEHLASGGISVAGNATCSFLAATPGAKVSVSSLTTVNGSTLEAQFSGLSGNPTAPVVLATNLVINGTVGVNIVAGSISAGQIPLIGYGSLSGSGNLVLGQLPQGVVATIVTNAEAKTIDLLVTAVNPLVWTGSVNGTWDLTTTNWTLSGTPTLYGQGDNVRFDDAGTTPLVSMIAALTPGSVTVSNSAQGYLFTASGAGSLNGSMSMVKQGTNSLTLNSPNSFLGNVTVEAGTLRTASGTALGSDVGPTTVANGATIDIYGQNLGSEHISVGGTGVGGTGALVNTAADQNDALRNVTLTGNTTVATDTGIGLRTGADSDLGLVGNGYRLTKIGSGSFKINGGKTVAGLTNIWTTDLGDIDIRQGNISFQRRTALGNPTNTITIWPGASLDLFSLNQALPVPTNRIVMTNASLRGTGADGDINTFGGKITLIGTNNINIDPWTGATGPTLLNLDGPIVGSGSANYDCDNSVIRLGGANTYSGNTSISNGTVQLAESGALAGTASILVRSNGILDVTLIAPWTLGASQTLAGSGTVNGEVMVDGTLSPGASAGTLTFSSTLTLAGSANMEVGKFGGMPTSDLAAVASTLTQGGVLNVSLLPGSETLAVNDEFTLFTAGGGITDAFTTVNLPGGYTWDTSTLATDGKIKVLSVTGGAPTITYSFTGGSISLNWTGDYLGWHLEAQTNSLAAGLTPGGWYPVPGSDLITSTNIVVDSANPTVFYRLVAP